MSGGQEQRVGIARAIVANPTVVVADEPTGSLDDETTEQILQLLSRVNDELGMTLLMVTHDADDVRALAASWVVAGAVIGMALYEGKMQLSEAIEAAGEDDAG